MEDGGVGSGIFEGEMGVGNKHPVGPFNPPGRKYPTTYFVSQINQKKKKTPDNANVRSVRTKRTHQRTFQTPPPPSPKLVPNPKDNLPPSTNPHLTRMPTIQFLTKQFKSTN